MKRIIFILCLFPMSAFSQEKDPLAKLYLKSGYIAEGKIIFVGDDLIRFNEYLPDDETRISIVYKSSIYLLISIEGKILIHNPEHKEGFESHGLISPLQRQGEESSNLTTGTIDNLYSIFGVIMKGTIILNDSTFIYFLRTNTENENIPRKIFKSNIYMLINSEGDTVVFNPDKEKEYTERRKNLIDKAIIKEYDTSSQVVADKSLIDKYAINIPDSKAVKVFNPDGEIGTAFIDLGTILPFGDVQKTSNIFAEIGVPVSKQATLFGGFYRSSTSIPNSESISFSAFSLKLRFYIGNK